MQALEIDATEHNLWYKNDRNARSIIGLTLSVDLLEQFEHAATEKEMRDRWSKIKIFGFHFWFFRFINGTGMLKRELQIKNKLINLHLRFLKFSPWFANIQRQTLLNNLSIRLNLCTATFNDGEKLQPLASWFTKLVNTMKSIYVIFDSNEIAISLLISDLEALGDNYKDFTFEFMKINCVQE